MPEKTRASEENRSSEEDLATREDDAVTTPFYFAYGSNMDEAQMASRVPGSRVISPAWLAGHEFLFSGYSRTWNGSVANVRKKKGSKVFGVVYALPLGGLDRLDRFEGYPTSYSRKTVNVRLTTGSKTRLSAVLYFKRATKALAPPNPVYVAQIHRALRRFGAN